MFVYCECGYDSGDEPDRDKLIAKVNADGGKAEATDHGIVVVCPRCGADDDRVGID